eukprot:scaffold647809_cov22-Prasinocladus_malaysianus.AAC.1
MRNCEDAHVLHCNQHAVFVESSSTAPFLEPLRFLGPSVRSDLTLLCPASFCWATTECFKMKVISPEKLSAMLCGSWRYKPGVAVAAERQPLA